MQEQGWIYQQVFNSGDPTLVVEMETLQILAANDSLAELSGRALTDLVGQPIGFLTRPQGGAEVGRQRVQLAILLHQLGQEIPVEIQFLYLEKSPRPSAILRISTVVSAPEPADGARSVLETRHVALQRAHRDLQSAYNRLELLNDELNSRNHELREIYRRLAQASKMAAIGELAAGTIHGINNPLAAAISANREMLQLLPGAPDIPARTKLQALCDRSERALLRIEGIVADLYRLARAGNKRGEMKQVQLVREIRLSLELLVHRLDQVEVSVDVPAEIHVRVAPDEFNQVVMNLLDNAVTAMQGQGSVWIRARQEGEESVLTIEDSGPGIEAEVRERVFEPFFTTKSPGAGSGIGLSVVRGIIEGYAGTIDVESAQGRGARFSIRLPGEVNLAQAPQNPRGG